MADATNGSVDSSRKADGGVLVALFDGLYDFDPASEALELRVRSPLPPHVALHECHCDRQGRFWIGSYDQRFPADRNARDAGFFRLDGDVLTQVLDGMSVANGLAFSPNGTTMYLADSPTRRVDAFDLDPATGAISDRRTFVQLLDGEGFVDGATVDSEGGYWLANVAAGALRRYRPDGTLDRIIALPFSNPTKPAFGGSDLRTLFVTSTQMAMPAFMEPTAPNGGVYCASSPGRPELPRFPSPAEPAFSRI